MIPYDICHAQQLAPCSAVIREASSYSRDTQLDIKQGAETLNTQS